jgi:hypothetical protein
MKMMTFKTKLELKGSSSLASQRFFGDYDLFCVMEKPKKDEFFKFIVNLIKKIEDSPDLWFIELKLQGKKKVKFYQGDVIEFKNWADVDFIKMDIVARIENRFTEVSVIYSFVTTPISTEEYITSLKTDIKDLQKEGKYYKILKRQFNIAKAQGNRKELLRLGKVFNGPLGEKYQILSNLDAIQLVLEHYQDEDLVKKIEINLKDLKLEQKSLIAWTKEQNAELNQSAKLIFNSS